MLKQKIEHLIKQSIIDSLEADELGDLAAVPESIAVEYTKNPEHGDRAISIAMKLAKEAKMQPRAVAEAIVSHLDEADFNRIDIAGPGFINLTLNWDLLEEAIVNIHCQDEDYGRIHHNDRPDQSYSKVLIEYVSANPTGDLHLGHGRQAVLGSALANLLKFAGYQVGTEFYINDAGAQILKLSNSAKQAIMIQEGLLEESAYDHENNYPLDSMLEFLKPEVYLPKLVKILGGEQGAAVVNDDGTKQIAINLEAIQTEVLGGIAKNIFIDAHRNTLQSVGTDFDNWYSETENIHLANKVVAVCNQLLESGHAYEKDDALWFKSSDEEDTDKERDRVLRKSDGFYTYLAVDLAYHQDKLARGYDKLINLWGADHHGQVPGITTALAALGEPADRLEVLLIQMVSLSKGGTEVKMSKREGNIVTINELVAEVGADAFRYFLIESQANNRIVFDLELACKQDKDNPVYYVQYAHARCCSILRALTGDQVDQTAMGEESKSAEAIITHKKLDEWFDDFREPGLFAKTFLRLQEDELSSTKALVLALANFPEEIRDAALTKSPYKIANYIKLVAGLFHQFYTYNRVICEDENLMKARTSIVVATQKTLRNALKILDISAPKKM